MRTSSKCNRIASIFSWATKPFITMSSRVNQPINRVLPSIGNEKERNDPPVVNATHYYPLICFRCYLHALVN